MKLLHEGGNIELGRREEVGTDVPHHFFFVYKAVDSHDLEGRT